MQDDKIIDLTPYLKISEHRLKRYGSKIYCPKCECTDYFAFYSKVHANKTIYPTVLVCKSDECDGNTIIEIKNGVFV